MINRTFVLAGKAIFTLEIPQSFSDANGTASHYTYRVTRKEATDRWPEAYFVGLLTGPDNTSDYTYLGMLDKETGSVRLTRASKYDEKSWPYRLLCRILQRIWADETEKIEEAHFALHHEGYCCRCGKTLTVPLSCTMGIGPECMKIMGIEPPAEAKQEVSETEEKPKKGKRRRKAG